MMRLLSSLMALVADEHAMPGNRQRADASRSPRARGLAWCSRASAERAARTASSRSFLALGRFTAPTSSTTSPAPASASASPAAKLPVPSNAGIGRFGSPGKVEMVEPGDLRGRALGCGARSSRQPARGPADPRASMATRSCSARSGGAPTPPPAWWAGRSGPMCGRRAPRAGVGLVQPLRRRAGTSRAEPGLHRSLAQPAARPVVIVSACRYRRDGSSPR